MGPWKVWVASLHRCAETVVTDLKTRLKLAQEYDYTNAKTEDDTFFFFFFSTESRGSRDGHLLFIRS